MATAAGVRRPATSWWALLLRLLLPRPGSAHGDRLACTVPDEASNDALADIYDRNCKLVHGLKKQLDAARDMGIPGVSDADQQRAINSKLGCDRAFLKFMAGNYSAAAKLAVEAWRDTVTGENLCCTLVIPPFCTQQHMSASTKAMLAPIAVTLVFVVCVSLDHLREKIKKSCAKRKNDETEKQTKRREYGASQDPQQDRAWRPGTEWPTEPRVKMRAFWTGHCLSNLPEGAVSGEDVVSVFHAFTLGFGFQEQNARNQHEHFLSLWRSQVAMEADKEVQEGRDGGDKQREFLDNSLDALHEQLLEGFGAWRTRFEPHLGRQPGLPRLLQDKRLLNELGIDPARVRGDDQGQKLAEMVVFLLVWGEAGNLRFMPEVLYFITDLVLASGQIGDAKGHDTWFLANIVRPIYNAVFDEHYNNNLAPTTLKARESMDEAITVPGGHFVVAAFYGDAERSKGYDVTSIVKRLYAEGKSIRASNGLFGNNSIYGTAKTLFVDVDVNAEQVLAWNNLMGSRQLKDGFQAYLPSRAANHDDWNELFCDPGALVSRLKMRTSSGGETQRLLKNKNVRHEDMLRRLPDVDWGGSLKNLKTHRELHSLVGVFATTHRVVLLHMVMFAVSMCLECGDKEEKWRMASSPRCGQLGGESTLARFASVGLLVPFHGSARAFALWRVSGRAKPTDVGFLVPLATFVLLRTSCPDEKYGVWVAGLHILVSVVGLVLLLLVPSTFYRRFPFEIPTPSVAWRQSPFTKSMRYFAWFCTLAVKFYFGLKVFIALNNTMEGLQISRPGRESVDQISQLYFGATWCNDVLLWLVLWGVTLALYFVDTQYWFLLQCTIVGVCTTFWRRFSANDDWWLTACCDAVRRNGMSELKSRFEKKVLCHLSAEDDARANGFRTVWNEIVEQMREDDDIRYTEEKDMKFQQGALGEDVPPQILADGLRCCPDFMLPRNDDAQWRLLALSRGLRLPMQRPYQAPYIPGITVLIPCYTEDIYTDMGDPDIQKDKEQRNKSRDLLLWLAYRYPEELNNYRYRHRVEEVEKQITNKQSDKEWASLRQQTLFRTITGMCLYHKALQKHYEVQGIKDTNRCHLLKSAGGYTNPRQSANGVDTKPRWSADVFTCMAAMQVYACSNCNKQKISDIHELILSKKTYGCLKVAYIGYSSKDNKHSDKETSGIDNVHQKFRYYSCLIDDTCLGSDNIDDSGRVREPKFKIELPGFPVLGDGKGDNQNNSIPFMRGHYVQTMDMNQGAFFEQMLLLPCALGEFRMKGAHDRDAGKKILGFPEQITSDIGSVGEFAASAETAFGTLLQRAYNVLGARMHYGHPDIMNKLYMMQQGGVSKATKTLHLSEDIFAGMDFTLRGSGRQIKHCEYMHFSKGRDMGFMSVLGFFSKLSSGTGEQVLTRQTFRLEQVLELSEALCFYHAHAGYYLIQFMIAWAMPTIVFVWLLVLVSACEGDVCVTTRVSTAEAMIPWLSALCSRTLIMFVILSSLPWIAESTMQRGVLYTLRKFLWSYMTASPLLFVFQSKLIGHYIMNEDRYGGATYVATGRGLPTERIPFMRWRGNEVGKRQFEGLYHGYSSLAHYDGVMLLIGIILVWLAGGIPTSEVSSQTSLCALVLSYFNSRLFWILFCCGLVIISWLWAPYIFNPYQFRWSGGILPGQEKDGFNHDLASLKDFFWLEGGEVWLDWYWTERVKLGDGSYRLYSVIWDISFFLFVFAFASWYLSVTVKVRLLSSLLSNGSNYYRLYAYALFPPVFSSFIICVGALLVHLFRECRARTSKDEICAPLLQGKRDRRSDMLDCGFLNHCPLPVLAAAVVLVDCLESYWMLMDFHTIGWTKALLAGLVLKMIGLSAMTLIGEGTLRSPAFTTWCGCARTVLEAWVCAHRMAKDALTCLVILPPLLLRALLDSLNRYFCFKHNMHHMILYRQWGHEAAMRQWGHMTRQDALEEGCLPRLT